MGEGAHFFVGFFKSLFCLCAFLSHGLVLME